MVRRGRLAAWAALFAMALLALSPLAAPAPRAGAAMLHDICSSAPAAPQPAGNPGTSHCALCVQPASMAPKAFAAPGEPGFCFPSVEFPPSAPPGRLAYTDALARAPPASA
jgi:hypothetical protein